MNLLLKELADRAGFDMATIKGDHEEALDNFAQLILQECIRLVDRPTTLPELTYSNLIKNYFGIKE